MIEAIKRIKEKIKSGEIRLGMTRQELKAILGEPTDWNRGTRKYPKPTVYKYENNDIEFTFEYSPNGGLVWVFYEDPDLTPHMLLKEGKKKMSDDYDPDTRIHDLFEKANDDYHKFEKIPKAERRHSREDLCAMLYLDEKLGGKGDAVSAAEHDQIWLGFEKLERLTEEDILYITRCGVMYDSETDSLFMWA